MVDTSAIADASLSKNKHTILQGSTESTKML
jgi:hypothetical protein